MCRCNEWFIKDRICKKVILNVKLSSFWFFFLVYLFMGILLFNKPYYEMTLQVNLVSQHVGYTSYLKTTSKITIFAINYISCYYKGRTWSYGNFVISLIKISPSKDEISGSWSINIFYIKKIHATEISCQASQTVTHINTLLFKKLFTFATLIYIFFFQLAEKPNNASLEKWKHQSKSQRSMVIRSWYYTKAYWRVVTSKISSITRIVMKVSLIRLKLKLN